MKESIKISIVTPSYNQGQFIEDTILSVLNQTYKNIEYIIVDGGSTDNTLDIINKYKDKIDIIISERDNGQSDAINKGFNLSTGVLAGWINSDDILYPDCIENLVKAYNQNSSAAVYFCPRLDIVNEEGKLLYTNFRPITDKNYLLKMNYDVNQPTSFYNRDLLGKIGYLNEEIKYCMDLDLWLNLLDYGGIYPISENPQGAIRRWEGTKTSTGTIDFLREIRTTLHKHGANPRGRLSIKTYYQAFKFKIKKTLIRNRSFINL